MALHTVAGVQVEDRWKLGARVQKKKKEKRVSVFPLIFLFPKFYSVKENPHVQVKKHTMAFIYVGNDCSAGKQKMVVQIHALFWRTLISCLKECEGKSASFVSLTPTCFLQQLSVSPTAAQLLRFLWVLKGTLTVWNDWNIIHRIVTIGFGTVFFWFAALKTWFEFSFFLIRCLCGPDNGTIITLWLCKMYTGSSVLKHNLFFSGDLM